MSHVHAHPSRTRPEERHSECSGWRGGHRFLRDAVYTMRGRKARVLPSLPAQLPDPELPVLHAMHPLPQPEVLCSRGAREVLASLVSGDRR